jgi:DNA-binding transcriptional regulator YhcF (GntR family)
VIELRQGAGAFVSDNAPSQQDAERLQAAQALVAQGIQRLRARGLTDEQIRRLVEAELAGITRREETSAAQPSEGKRG